MKSGGGDRSSLAAKTTTLMTNPQLMRMKMPRPKSDLTGVTISISARLRPQEHKEWKRLGGVNWLRQQLRESIQKQKEQK